MVEAAVLGTSDGEIATVRGGGELGNGAPNSRSRWLDKRPHRPIILV